MPTEQGESRRSTVRVPVEAQVRVRFEDQARFVTAYAANISLNGMFIATQQPRPAGTRLHFELRLSDDSLIKGVAEVVWSRLGEESEERPAGMGIRVFQFDQDSRNNITRLIDQHVYSRRDPAVPGPH